MRWADLVDLEVQMLRDESRQGEGTASDLLARDRTIGEAWLRQEQREPDSAREALEVDLSLRQRAALAWIEVLRERGGLPGSSLARSYRVLGWVLSGVAFLLGSGTARAVLAYDGVTPVNVFGFLLVFVLVQIALLVLLILAMTLRWALRVPASALTWAERLVDLVGRIPWLGGWTRRTRERLAAQSGGWRAELARLQGRRRLHAELERWTLFTLVQRFGIWFNVGALVTFLALVTFTDMAFSWSTTLDLDGHEVRRLLHVLAWPWASWSGLVPSAEVIHDSEWIRQGGRGFVGGGDRAEVKVWAQAWWRFLLAAQICWGLLPRVLAFGVGRWRIHQLSRATPCDHAGYLRLFERMLPPPVAWVATPTSSPETSVAPVAPSPATASTDRPPKTPRGPRPGRSSGPVTAGKASGGAALVLWGTLGHQSASAEDHVGRRWGRPVGLTVRAGGSEVRDDEVALQQILSRRCERVGLVVEAGVQPTKEIFRFLSELRNGCGPRVPLSVFLVDPRPAGWVDGVGVDRDAWKLRVAGEGDPYLHLDTLVASP